MTAGAQQALRRTMEIYSNTTRFALACNQSNKIIEPIQSRCAILRYSKLTDSQVMKRLLELCKEEDVSISYPLGFPDLTSLTGPIQRRWSQSTHLHLRRGYATSHQ